LVLWRLGTVVQSRIRTAICRATTRPAVHCRFGRMRQVPLALDHNTTKTLRVLTNLPKDLVVGGARFR
jgi:hypothetical protein